MPLPHRALPVLGAGSVWVHASVSGPRRTAALVHTGRDAAYFDLDGRALAVLGARAVAVPCGVRLPLAELPDVTGPATVGEGCVEVGGMQVLVTELVETTVPSLGLPDAVRGGAELEAVSAGRLDAVEKALPPEPLRLLADCDPDAVLGLLGLGAGLTPLGDDVLAGWLATAVASRHPARQLLRDAVLRHAYERTTTLSATLLECAGRGEAVPPFRSLLTGIATANVALVEQAAELVLRIGATSGQGLLLGALVALQSPSLLAPTSVPTSVPTSTHASPPHEGTVP